MIETPADYRSFVFYKIFFFIKIHQPSTKKQFFDWLVKS